MAHLAAKTLKIIEQDLDRREDVIRDAVYDVLSGWPAPDVSEHVVATYFIMTRSSSPARAGDEIAHLMSTSIHDPAKGSLLDQCTAEVTESTTFDAAGRIGMVRVAFPLKMLEDADGNVYSTHLLHIAGGAAVFALTEHPDAKLVDLAMSEDVLRRFPGPAYGAPGARKTTGFDEDEIAFGTILKPCTGMTPEEEARIVTQVAANPMFLFIKEDENFLPNVPFAPLAERLAHSLAAVARVAEQRGGKGLIYAPHITSPPHLLTDNVRRAVDAGVNGVMFSEYCAEGAVRTVREMTRTLDNPPAIYGHNGGITCRTRHIYREVLDRLARLDGIDFRQTAAQAHGPSMLRPAGREWRKCERVLSEPLAGHPPVMIARAGGLDQGNIIVNLLDVAAGAGAGNYIFLAGSAINSIKDADGRYDSTLGAEAMRQALAVYAEGVFDEATATHVQDLKRHAETNSLDALATALSQRYGL